MDFYKANWRKWFPYTTLSLLLSVVTGSVLIINKYLTLVGEVTNQLFAVIISRHFYRKTGRVGHFIEFQGVKISHSPEDNLPPSLMFWHFTCVLYSLHLLLGLIIFVLIRRTPSGDIFLSKNWVIPIWYICCIILW